MGPLCDPSRGAALFLLDYYRIILTSNITDVKSRELFLEHLIFFPVVWGRFFYLIYLIQYFRFATLCMYIVFVSCFHVQVMSLVELPHCWRVLFCFLFFVFCFFFMCQYSLYYLFEIQRNKNIHIKKILPVK